MNEYRTSTAPAAMPVNDVVIRHAAVDGAARANDLGAFLGTLATLLRETIARFEQTADRVSDMVIAHTGRAGPELMHAIQDFDRLQQELGAVGDVLSRLEISTAGAWPGNPAVSELKADLLNCVTIADVKRRLAVHFERPASEGERAVPTEQELTAEF